MLTSYTGYNIDSSAKKALLCTYLIKGFIKCTEGRVSITMKHGSYTMHNSSTLRSFCIRTDIVVILTVITFEIPRARKFHNFICNNIYRETPTSCFFFSQVYMYCVGIYKFINHFVFPVITRSQFKRTPVAYFLLCFFKFTGPNPPPPF